LEIVTPMLSKSKAHDHPCGPEYLQVNRATRLFIAVSATAASSLGERDFLKTE